MSTQSQGPTLTRVADDVESWPAQILSAMHQHFPFLGNYDLDFHIAQQDPEAGFAYGSVAVRNIIASTLPGVGLDGNFIRIPFVMEGFMVKKPMAFEVGGTMYALNESRIRSAMLTTAIGTSPENPMVRTHSLVDDLMPPQATRQGGMTQNIGMGSGGVKSASADEKDGEKETIEPELKHVRDDWERRWVRQFKDTPLYTRAIEAVQDSPEQLSAIDAQKAMEQAKRAERRAILGVLTTRMGSERARLQVALSALGGKTMPASDNVLTKASAHVDGEWCEPFRGTALYEDALKLHAQMAMLSEAEASTWDDGGVPQLDSKWSIRQKAKRSLETELAVWRYESASGKKLAPIAAKVMVDVLDLEKTAALQLHFTADNEITKSFKPAVPLGYRTFTVPGSKFVISVPAALAKRLLTTKSVAETHKLLLPAMLESMRAVKSGKSAKALLLWVVDAQGNAVQQKVPLQNTAEVEKTAGKAGVCLARMLSDYDTAPRAMPRRSAAPKGKAKVQTTAPSPGPTTPTPQAPKPGWRPDRVHATGAGIVAGAVGFDRLQDNGNKYASAATDRIRQALRNYTESLTGKALLEAREEHRARQEALGPKIQDISRRLNNGSTWTSKATKRKMQAAEEANRRFAHAKKVSPNSTFADLEDKAKTLSSESWRAVNNDDRLIGRGARKLNILRSKYEGHIGRAANRVKDVQRTQRKTRGLTAAAVVGTGALSLAAARHFKNKRAPAENPDAIGKEASAMSTKALDAIKTYAGHLSGRTARTAREASDAAHKALAPKMESLAYRLGLDSGGVPPQAHRHSRKTRRTIQKYLDAATAVGTRRKDLVDAADAKIDAMRQNDWAVLKTEGGWQAFNDAVAEGTRHRTGGSTIDEIGADLHKKHQTALGDATRRKLLDSSRRSAGYGRLGNVYDKHVARLKPLSDAADAAEETRTSVRARTGAGVLGGAIGVAALRARRSGRAKKDTEKEASADRRLLQPE